MGRWIAHTKDIFLHFYLVEGKEDDMYENKPHRWGCETRGGGMVIATEEMLEEERKREEEWEKRALTEGRDGGEQRVGPVPRQRSVRARFSAARDVDLKKEKEAKKERAAEREARVVSRRRSFKCRAPHALTKKPPVAEQTPVMEDYEYETYMFVDTDTDTRELIAFRGYSGIS